MFNNRCLRDFPSIYVCCCLNLTSTKILDCYSSFRNSSFSGFRLARVWKRLCRWMMVGKRRSNRKVYQDCVGCLSVLSYKKMLTFFFNLRFPRCVDGILRWSKELQVYARYKRPLCQYKLRNRTKSFR